MIKDNIYSKRKIIKINFWGKEREIIIQKHHFSRNIRLSISSDQKILISVPLWLSFRQAEDFFWKKKDWVSKVIFKNQQKNQDPILKNYSNLLLNYKNNYSDIKKKARQIAQKKTLYFNQWYDFKYEKIFIRNQKTRWGSCSNKRNLSFNVKIALLPSHLQDYIVVHELCHLKEMNHSFQFWSLVSKTIPDYKKRRMELKKFN